ncbi:Hypothetical_protein [Hexamita inflata]|uniref:Hypothetical_protein n=1 Tax=Hexamita inflata TaxID=28002 RepID=A0AA86PCS4_9EUKA|nr:Hypothetical protein HINF_LOCUS21157 [Hexamita inflata]
MLLSLRKFNQHESIQFQLDLPDKQLEQIFLLFALLESTNYSSEQQCVYLLEQLLDYSPFYESHYQLQVDLIHHLLFRTSSFISIQYYAAFLSLNALFNLPELNSFIPFHSENENTNEQIAVKLIANAFLNNNENATALIQDQNFKYRNQVLKEVENLKILTLKRMSVENALKYFGIDPQKEIGDQIILFQKMLEEIGK